MRVLVGCEYSGLVRDAFAARGHNAWSCDLLPTDRPGQHIKGDVLGILDRGWDMAIFFPPCTYLASSGLHWNLRRPERVWDTLDAVAFVGRLASAPIAKIAIENPIGRLSSAWRKPDQVIQPWWFGDDASKATCLWLKGLDHLWPTKDCLGGDRKTIRANQTPSGQNKLGPSADRWKLRSTTYPGVAAAFAEQWG